MDPTKAASPCEHAGDAFTIAALTRSFRPSESLDYLKELPVQVDALIQLVRADHSNNGQINCAYLSRDKLLFVSCVGSDERKFIEYSIFWKGQGGERMQVEYSKVD